MGQNPLSFLTRFFITVFYRYQTHFKYSSVHLSNATLKLNLWFDPQSARLECCFLTVVTICGVVKEQKCVRYKFLTYSQSA